jgi:hypothetical protein
MPLTEDLMMVTIFEPKPIGERRSAAEAWVEMWIMIDVETNQNGCWIVRGTGAVRVGYQPSRVWGRCRRSIAPLP